MLSFSIEKLGFKPENSIMVGDSDNDIIPAQKLGMKSIFVTYGYGKVNNLINPNYLIDDFKEIIEIVKN
jgi:FMN phosphatase YigB (HAD superfamily)